MYTQKKLTNKRKSSTNCFIYAVFTFKKYKNMEIQYEYICTASKHKKHLSFEAKQMHLNCITLSMT